MRGYNIQYQVGYNLRILFVGINPHPGSYARGVPFSNNKMFWYLLSDAGLLPQSREQLRNDAYLKRLYLYAFKKTYRFGLINIIDRPTVSTVELKKAEAEFGRKRLRVAIRRYKPLCVCFVGKVTYRMFSQASNVEYGWQPTLESSKLFVMHAPHHGLASIRIKELQEIAKAAGE